MLPKPHRLRDRRHFTIVYQKGIRRNSQALSLRAYQRQPHADLQLPTRVGFSISLKVSKRAVIRNRIKRQLRAALRPLLIDVAPGWDLVIVVRPNAVECDYLDFLQQLKQLLAQAEIFHGH